MDTRLLEKLGLTKSEIRVYVALLELGASKTGVLTSKAKVSRSKIYEILDKLIEKGLASYVVKENTKYFEAADPRNLKEYVRKKKKELEEQDKELDELMHSLLGLQKSRKEKQKATVFEGFKGIKAVFNDVLNTMKRGEEYFAFAAGKEYYTTNFSIFIMNYHKKREEKGIKVKLLSNVNIKDRVVKELRGYKNIRFKFTDESTPTSTLIYGSKMFMFVWSKNPTAILIDSKDIVKQHKEHFMGVWKREKHF